MLLRRGQACEHGLAGRAERSGGGCVTSSIDAVVDTLDSAITQTTRVNEKNAKVIVITEEDFARGRKGRKGRESNGRDERDGQARVMDGLAAVRDHAELDPAVKETIERLIDTNKVIELERIDLATLPKRRVYRFVKRAFDIVSCSAALVILAIPMGVIAVMVKLDSPGPVFYVQERLGRGGVPIKIVKFRSMRTDAEAMGAQWTQSDDPRVTRVGAFLRKTRLDELPQFLMVIKGDISLIGPRPEREVFYNEFEKYIHGFKQRMLVKPGITGLAQISGGYNLKPAEKVLYDLDYIKHASIGMDLAIIWKTLGVLFSHDGAR